MISLTSLLSIISWSLLFLVASLYWVCSIWSNLAKLDFLSAHFWGSRGCLISVALQRFSSNKKVVANTQFRQKDASIVFSLWNWKVSWIKFYLLVSVLKTGFYIPTYITKRVIKFKRLTDIMSRPFPSLRPLAFYFAFDWLIRSKFDLSKRSDVQFLVPFVRRSTFEWKDGKCSIFLQIFLGSWILVRGPCL